MNAFPLTLELGDQINTLLTLYGFAACLTNAGVFNAAILTGATERLSETVEFNPEPAERRFCGHYRENLQTAMSEANFSTAYAEGRNISVNDAASIALRGKV